MEEAYTPKWWAEKLYEDLAFAAPETWLFHIQRRFEEALEGHCDNDCDACRDEEN